MPLSMLSPEILSSDEGLTSILQRLQELSTQPTIPNNPLSQLGTVLSGFAAGTQGRANPVLEQAMEQRKTAFTQALSQANLSLSLRREASLETQRKEEKERHERTEKQRQLEFKAIQATNMLNTGLAQGNIELIRQSLKEQNALSISNWTPEQIESIAVKGPERERLLKDQPFLAAWALSKPNDPEIGQLAPHYVKLAQTNPILLRSIHKLDNPDLVLATEARKRAENATLTEQAKSNLAIAQGGTDPSLFIKANRAFNRETALLQSYMFENTGTPLAKQDKIYQDIRKMEELEREGKIKSGRAADLLFELKTQEKQLNVRKASREEFDALSARVKSLASSIVIMRDDPQANALALETAKALLIKTINDASLAAEREAKEAPTQEKAVRDAIEAARKKAEGKKPVPPKQPGKIIEELLDEGDYLRPGSPAAKLREKMRGYRPELIMPGLSGISGL